MRVALLLHGHRLILGLFKLALSMQHLVPGCIKSSWQDLVDLGTSPRRARRSSGRTVAGTADPEWEGVDAIVQGPRSAGSASHQEDSLGMFSILFRNKLVYSRLCIVACASLCSCFRSRTSAPGCPIGTTMRWQRCSSNEESRRPGSAASVAHGIFGGRSEWTLPAVLGRAGP